MKLLYIKTLLLIFTLSIFNNCNSDRMEPTNQKIIEYTFLKEMYEDQYFPNHIVDKGKNILLRLCSTIEQENPQSLNELYKLTHKSTDEFNELQNHFWENDSEIETVARECIAMDFDFIAKTYGFEADVEELIVTRDW